MPQILHIPHSHKLYPNLLALRQLILRDPLGMTFSATELEQDKQMSYFIYYDNDEILGTVSLEILSPKKGQLRQMAVHDKTQGKGVGRQIVTALENHSREIGLTEIHLDSRYPARGFYAKLGYTEYGDIYDKIGIKHINMKKSL